jgi:polar amino acid transport system substrate-binding protein
MENTMSKKVRLKIMWLLFLSSTLGIWILVGCAKSKQTFESVTEVPTQVEAVTVIPDAKVLLVTGEYVPYVGEALEYQGFITKLIETTLKVADIDYEIKFYPWARCSKMVESGEAWATYPYGHSETNDQTYLFSDTLYSAKHKFYYLRANDKIKNEVYDFTSIDDFKEYTFGGANGYWYGKPKDFAAHNVKVEWAGDTDALLKMLYSKRIDFFIEDELVCEEAIERLFPGEEEKFDTLPFDARTQDYYLMVSKDYPKGEELLNKFNKALYDVRNYVNSEN